MKNLVEFINESRYFSLEPNERDVLASFVGVLCGSLGDDEIEEKCADLIKELSDKDKDMLTSLYDCLDDTYNYKKINRNMIIDEIPLIKKCIEWCDENDAWVDSNDVELLDILDKINTK